MSCKMLERVMAGCSVGFRVAAFGAGIVASVGLDSVVAPCIAVASAVSAVVARYFVTKRGGLDYIEGQLLGVGTGFFCASALLTAPVASIGGAVCVGASLAVTVVRLLLDYCKKDEQDSEVELEPVLVNLELEKEFFRIMFRVEEDIASAENLMLELLFNIMRVKQQLKDAGFISLVDELNCLMNILNSEVRNSEDKGELQKIANLLKLGLGGEVLRKLSAVQAYSEKLMQRFKDLQEVVSMLARCDKNTKEQMLRELKAKVNNVVYGCFDLREEIRELLNLIKDPAVMAAFVNDVMRARDSVAKLMIDSNVDGRAPNQELYNELKQLDRKLVEYVRRLQELHTNKMLEKVVKNMFEEAQRVHICATSLQHLFVVIRVPNM